MSEPIGLDQAGAVLYNHGTQAYEFVPQDRLAAALDSGNYSAAGSTVTRAEGGLVTRDVADLPAVATSGETVASDVMAGLAADERNERQLRAYDTTQDKLATFGEAAIDAASLGFIRLPGEDLKISREVNSGSALLGQLAGFGVSMAIPGSPIARITEGGTKVGRAAARSILGARAEVGAGKMLTRGLEEAAVGAGLMGASSFGHQLTDAIIEDKPFSAEALVQEVSLGGLMGLGAGVLAGGFSAIANRGAATAQGGLVSGVPSTALEQIGGVRRVMDEAVEAHAQRYGVIEVLANEGKIPGLYMEGRAQALKEAQKAAKALDSFDPVKAFDAGPKDYAKYRQAFERYQEAVRHLDDQMRPGSLERVRPVKPGSPDAADDLFWRNQGRPQDEFQFAPEAPSPFKPFEENLGGKVTPSSEAKTGAQRGLAQGTPRLPKDLRPGTLQGGAPGPLPEGLPNPIVNEVDRASPFTELGTPPGQGPYVPPSAQLGGGFNPREFPSEMLDKRIQRRMDTDAWLGQDVHPHDQVLMRDGRILPAKAVDANAAQFDAFRQKLAVDTVLPKPPPMVEAVPAATEATVGKGTVRLAKGSRPGPTTTVADEALEAGSTVVDLPPAKPRVTPGQDAVRRYMDDWFAQAGAAGERVQPGDVVAARLQEALDNMAKVSGGRLNSVGALEIGEKMGLPAAKSSLGERMDQVWSLKQAAKMAADEARGVATPLGKSGRNEVADWVARRIGGRIGAAAVGGMLGGPLGGAVGYAIGAAVASNYAGFAGRLASATGRVVQRVAEVGEVLLKGRRATMAARAVSGNRSYAYDDQGPIHDPVERIQTIRRLAADPDVVRAKVRTQLGDLVVTAPALAQAAEEQAVRQIQNLSIRAPAIYMSQLGVPINPSYNKLREWHEYENGTHDLEGLLTAIERGSATETQNLVLREQFPQAHAKLVEIALSDPERLRKLPTHLLRSVERVVGPAFPLTRASSDPAYVSRIQASWVPEPTQAPPAKPQALKITAPKPTPAQAVSSGRAPGNQE